MGLFVCFVHLQCTGLGYGFHYTLCDAWKENMEYFLLGFTFATFLHFFVRFCKDFGLFNW